MKNVVVKEFDEKIMVNAWIVEIELAHAQLLNTRELLSSTT